MAQKPRPPLKPAQHLVLLILAEQPTYGVALLDLLEARSGGGVRLNAGSLYRMLAQLLDEGLVTPLEDVASPAGVGAPRKVYGVTPSGLAALRAEASRQEQLLAIARSLDLLAEP